MNDPSILRPGDIMFSKIGNTLPSWLPRWAQFMPGTLPVGLGQWLLAHTSKEERNIDHVAVVVVAQRPSLIPLYDGADLNPAPMPPMIVQAMPSGAEMVEIGSEHWTEDVVYLRPAYQSADPTYAMDMPGHPYAIGQAGIVAEAARSYVDTPYSFLDYAAIALHHIDPVWRVSPGSVGSQPLARYVTDSGHMICSQLANQALSDAGFHVFTDGRLPQDVMPVELYRALLAMPDTKIIWPEL